jgi:topoisomerase-4 subunit A
MSEITILPENSDAENVDLQEVLRERYLSYALSTIMHRALPDVRDGLKPVHRRLLYAMRQLKLDPESGFKKCARVVGDVIGKYHPHGDQSVYDAMVRLAQDFAVRFPLVEGQGNFGNIDGDNAAAMRYTEARMTAVAEALLEGIDEDTVDFRETYDGEDKEPAVLPANFPNLLANGASGIAVGMATSIPPHNAGELCNAALHLIKYPNASTKTLVGFVRGPDFPTGGVLIDDEESIIEAYETGRGGFRVRARWHREDIERGAYRIIVTEIPYQVQKSKLVEKIADLMHAKKLPLLGDVVDESAEDIRLVLEPRSRTVDPLVLMEAMFRLTDLETRIPLNMNVLSHNQIPNVLGLGEVLRQWLEHRKEVLVRSSRFRLQKIEHRLEVLDGFLVCFLNIDEVIRIIRFEDHPRQELMRRFELSEVQTDAILNMRLRALHKLQEIEIRTEHADLSLKREELLQLLGSDDLQWQKIAAEIRQIREKFGTNTEIGRRRATFDEAPNIDVDIAEAIIEREPVTVVLSQKGWIKAMRGHVTDTGGLQFKAGDALKTAIRAQTTDKIVLFASNGKFYTLDPGTLPGGRGHGEPIRLIVDLEEGHDIVDAFVHEPGRKLLVASGAGNGFVVSEDGVIATTRKGKQVLNVKAPEVALKCTPANGDMVAVIGDNRKLLIFPLSELNEMSRGRGVRLQRYAKGKMADVSVFASEDGLGWCDKAKRNHKLAEFNQWLGGRSQAGKPAPKGFPKNNEFGFCWQ